MRSTGVNDCQHAVLSDRSPSLTRQSSTGANPSIADMPETTRSVTICIVLPNLTYIMVCLTFAQADTLPCGSVRSRKTYQFKASETASPAAFHDLTPHEHMQVLSNAEEKTSVRWNTHLTITGFPALPSLAIAIAEEIRKNRYQVAWLPPSYPRPIGKSWLDRFAHDIPTSRAYGLARLMAQDI
jgi:hypothetical protein